MTLSVGDRIPAANLFEPGASGPDKLTTDALFQGRKVVLVGMPGAFTPTCHRNHLPGFIENRDAILAKGVDEIVVLSTNDTHVLRAWAEASGGKDKVRFVSDGNAEFISKAGPVLRRLGHRHGHARPALRDDRRRRRGDGACRRGEGRPDRRQHRRADSGEALTPMRAAHPARLMRWSAGLPGQSFRCGPDVASVAERRPPDYSRHGATGRSTLRRQERR